jgi:glycosyltransferase involved in cell wall biosynthesis
MTANLPRPGIDLSVIVPCYQHAEELPGCLEALSRQQTTVSYEVIVVDSGNAAAVRAVCAWFPQVRVLSAADRLYCGAAKHLGAQAAAGRRLAFTDADCRPEPDWVENAFRCLEAGHRMAGGPVLDGLPHSLISVCDNILQFSDVQTGRPAGPIRHVPGCNLVVWKQDYEEAGGFSPRNSGDDVLLTMRFNQIHPDGIYFWPKMKVKHLGRTSLASYLQHHYAHGLSRGELGLHLTARQQRLGRHRWMIPVVAVWRYRYILMQRWKYNRARALRHLALAPLLLLGLGWYAAGFQAGCRLNESNSEEQIDE